MNSLIWNGRAWVLIGLGVLLGIAEPSYAAAPVALAGDDANAITDQPVSLDGSASSNPDDDPLTFEWTFAEVPSGSTATLSNATTAQPFFTPDVAGLYRLTLTVSDGNQSASDEVDITVTPVTPPNEPPTANAGPDQPAVVALTLVTLDGSASNDPDSGPSPLTFQWTFAEKPTGSLLTDITNATSAQASFTPDVAGLYRLTLTVSDGDRSASDEVDITVTPVTPPNEPPTANAGPDQPAVVALTLVTLDGSASNDPDSGPSPLTFQWTFAEVPSGSTAILSNATTAQPFFTPDVAGLYRLTLTVSDGNQSASDEVDITVTPVTPPNEPPTANAGPDQPAVVALTLVTLDGSASNDPDSGPSPLTFQWTFAEKPTGSLLTDITNATSAQASFTPDVAGLYRLTLTVSDGDRSASDEVDITVTPVTPPNEPPTANAGPDQPAVVALTLVTLDGSASNDPDSGPSPLTFQWTFAEKPTGSLLTDITNATSAQASFTPDLSGLYRLTLTVSDGHLSASDEVDINANMRPNANAGPDQTAEALTTLVTLNGSGNDPDSGPNPLTFQWAAQVPTGSNAEITNPTSPQASFTPDVAGLYRLRLTVSDGDLSDSDDVDITVTPAPADLELGLTGTPDLLTVDGQLTYTITVRNNGPGTATGVQVVDSLPPGAVLEGFADSSQGECSSDTVTVVCDLETLAADDEATVTINVNPTSAEELSNAAEVFSDIDPVPVNNSRTETTTVEEPVPDLADLAVTAEATPVPGTDGKLTYTLKVTNNGQATATDVELTNDLPADVVLKAITPSTCRAADPALPVLCDLGTLPSGETRIVTIDVMRPVGRTLPNRAAINGDQRDPDPLNNFALTSALDLAKRQTTCTSKRCKLRLNCNKSGFLGGMCKNRIKLFVDTRAPRNTRALQLSDARVARGRVPFAVVSKTFRGDTTNNIVRLRLTREGREFTSMQGRKGFRGKMRIISNGTGGQDIMRLWVRLK